ncbi:TetR/AcrR family transcriptional regulator [Nonomuraea sp. 3-1Str]|uniref:TetR/AcrR family transcriptional regulator n=1 Tax=Nonomuraea sp. 3-1Str TaxID=2929801 RepID=UPI002865856A|nr:TetR/AcrR family transcriptional regulator [Nonomuraea sp. 3-1Str]MDR8407258.1 TetR/AcrR family transcriptional regulator [Nonomuraea sp. 3-1Str]
MSQLVEHHSRKAARILDSTRRLVLDHGVRKVTVTEITRSAGVGKGTVYLYWPTKEDLILGLFARDLLTFLDEVIGSITADPADVLPRRLAPLLIRTGSQLPLAHRLRSDAELLRLLTQHAGDRELFARTRPSALCNAVMPILHRHGLVRHDRPLPSQAYALHAVLTGFGTAMTDPATAPLGVDDPYEVLADTVAQLLEPSTAPGEPAITAAADQTVAVFRETRDAVLDLIDRGQTLQQ